MPFGDAAASRRSLANASRTDNQLPARSPFWVIPVFCGQRAYKSWRPAVVRRGATPHGNCTFFVLLDFCGVGPRLALKRPAAGFGA
ncbi:hypothetical protein LLP99_22405 [Rouxiella badensis]|uniref:hypothetical protein n=1 Tax=Rouxiella badensis TaxID=1646377 RepID=UPI001D15113E|nr:hypothetical protein [Rouxiella badensis]MCC3721485.1 hypothetical protein [Rouxiella badensis]MCC3731065.1 hypothetical protein [Rouxiella badensis]